MYRLPITDRLRFALEEEEEFRKRFYQHETQALKDESSIQIHIDAHKHALGILMGIRKDFKLITKGATGTGMNGKIMADLLVKYAVLSNITALIFHVRITGTHFLSYNCKVSSENEKSAFSRRN